MKCVCELFHKGQLGYCIEMWCFMYIRFIQCYFVVVLKICILRFDPKTYVMDYTTILNLHQIHVCLKLNKDFLEW